MRLLLYGINYAPELTGIGKYTGEMAEWLVKKGHHVEVITTMPYYPEWKINKAYKGKGWHTEKINGVTVHRTPFYVPNAITGTTRILHEFSFLLSSQIHWWKNLFTSFDCIISISPPFHISLPALFYGFLKNTPVIYHVQDLQVNAAKELKQITSKRLLRLLFRLEHFILTKCFRISSISHGMTKKIIAKGIPSNKISFFPNWVDADFVRPLSVEDSLKTAWGFSAQDKIILYSGNLGEKQGLDLLIEVANQLQTHQSLHFVIVGEGGIKKDLVQQVQDLQLRNVHFYPLQPYEQLSALLATADLHLILQKKVASDLVMPSKLTSILAASGVALVTATQGSNLYDIVKQNDLGILVEPENASALKTGILTALQTDLSPLKSNARSYAQNYLSKENILEQFEEGLTAIILESNCKYPKYKSS